MKTFQCNHCGAQVRRPTAPLKCDSCNAQRIGLFKAVDAPGAPAGSPPPGASAGSSPPGATGGLSTSASPPAAPAGSPPPPGNIAPPPPPGAPVVPPGATAGSPSSAPSPAAPTRPTPRPAPPASPPGATGGSPTSAPPPTQAPPKPTPKPKPKKKPAAKPKPVTPAPKPTPAEPKSLEPGAVVWFYPEWTPGEPTSRVALRNCPVFDNRQRIYAALGKDLVALAEHDQGLQVLWEYPSGGHIPGSPTLGSDGRIRIHAGDGQLHCVTDGGEHAWAPVSVGAPLDWASPVVDADSNTWVCAYGGGLVKLDSGGTRRGQTFFRSRQKFDSTGLVFNQVFYVGAEDAFVYAIDTAGDRGKNVWNHLKGQGRTDWFINSAIALTPHKELIVAGRDEYVYAFGRDGNRLWKLHIRGQMLASPVIDEQGLIYIGVSLVRRDKRTEGKLVCIDGGSHRVRWEYPALGAVESTPVIGDDGVVYFGDNGGTVHAVSPKGKRIWATNVKSPVRSAGTIPSPNRVVFGADSGSLVALACSSTKLAEAGWPKYMGLPLG